MTQKPCNHPYCRAAALPGRNKCSRHRVGLAIARGHPREDIRGQFAKAYKALHPEKPDPAAVYRLVDLNQEP